MGLHLGDVLAEVFDDGFSGDGLILWVVFDVVAEGGEVFVAVGLGQNSHLLGDAMDLIQADLMDPGGRQVSGSKAAKSSLISTPAAAKGVDGQRGSGVRDIVCFDEGGELPVGRKDLVVDGGGDLFGEA